MEHRHQGTPAKWKYSTLVQAVIEEGAKSAQCCVDVRQSGAALACSHVHVTHHYTLLQIVFYFSRRKMLGFVLWNARVFYFSARGNS